MKIKLNYARQLWLSLLLLVGVTAIAVPTLVENGEGTIEISTVEQLKEFRNAVNSGNTYAGKTVKLTADLDLSGESNWSARLRMYFQIATGEKDNDGNDICTNYAVYGFTDPDSINQENAKENQHELSGAVQTETGQCGGRSCRCEIR